MDYSSQYASIKKGDKLLVKFGEQQVGPYEALALGRAQQQTGKRDPRGVSRWKIKIAWEWATGKRQTEVIDCDRIFFGGRGTRRGTAFRKLVPPSLAACESKSPTAAIQDTTASITPIKKKSIALSLSYTNETVKRVRARKKAPERKEEFRKGGEKESEQRNRSIHDRMPKRPLPIGTRVEVFEDGRLAKVAKVVQDKDGFLEVKCEDKKYVRARTASVSVRFYDKDTNEVIGEYAELS